MAAHHARAILLSQEAFGNGRIDRAMPPDEERGVHLTLAWPNGEPADTGACGEAADVTWEPALTVPRLTRRSNVWVVLDRAWAERLGVRRAGGTYRIRRAELTRMLAQLGSKTAAPPALSGPAEAWVEPRPVV